jgi:hypothetical protein
LLTRASAHEQVAIELRRQRPEVDIDYARPWIVDEHARQLKCNETKHVQEIAVEYWVGEVGRQRISGIDRPEDQSGQRYLDAERGHEPEQAGGHELADGAQPERAAGDEKAAQGEKHRHQTLAEWSLQQAQVERGRTGRGF